MKTILRGMLLAMATTALLPVAYAEELPVITNRQLLVAGKAYLALGGELHNSSASSTDYMQPVWDKLQAMHVRTVASTVSWEEFEPPEGRYDEQGWKAGRVINGDERLTIIAMDKIGLVRLRLLRKVDR